MDTGQEKTCSFTNCIHPELKLIICTLCKRDWLHHLCMIEFDRNKFQGGIDKYTNSFVFWCLGCLLTKADDMKLMRNPTSPSTESENTDGNFKPSESKEDKKSDKIQENNGNKSSEEEVGAMKGIWHDGVHRVMINEGVETSNEKKDNTSPYHETCSGRKIKLVNPALHNILPSNPLIPSHTEIQRLNKEFKKLHDPQTWANIEETTKMVNAVEKKINGISDHELKRNWKYLEYVTPLKRKRGMPALFHCSRNQNINHYVGYSENEEGEAFHFIPDDAILHDDFPAKFVKKCRKIKTKLLKFQIICPRNYKMQLIFSATASSEKLSLLY